MNDRILHYSLSLSLNSQVVGIVIVLVCQEFKYPFPEELLDINKCGPPKLNESSMPFCLRPSSNQSIPVPFEDSTPLYDPRPSILFCLGIIFINFIFLTLCLWPKYKRLESEKRKSFEKSVCIKKWCLFICWQKSVHLETIYSFYSVITWCAVQ